MSVCQECLEKLSDADAKIWLYCAKCRAKSGGHSERIPQFAAIGKKYPKNYKLEPEPWQIVAARDQSRDS